MLFDVGTRDELPRGFLHPQWAVFPMVMVVGGVVAVVKRRTRRIGMMLWAGLLLQILAWMFFTHLQSRFLLPVAVMGCGMFGAGLRGALPARVAQSRASAQGSPREEGPWRGEGRSGAVIGAGVLVCIAMAGMGIGVFKAQMGGGPNLLLLESPWVRTGELDREALPRAKPEEQKDLIERMGPEEFVNVMVKPGTMVYLLGGATPLYFTCPVLYNTTWDKWPLGEAMRKSPGNSAAWTRELWDRGVRLVLVDEAEIERLTASGWADPMVTVHAVRSWLKDEGHLVRSWPRIGLFELKEPE
jgi:hypothetical protein